MATTAALLGVVATVGAQPAAYNIIDLGALGGDTSSALGLNERGQAVGRGPDADGAERAFLWSQGRIEDLGDLGGGNARAYAINDSGWVAGSSASADDPDGEYQAFVYDPAGGLIQVPGFGGSRSRAFALNNRGQAAGFARTTDGQFRAFLWSEESSTVDILAGRGAEGNSFGFGVNDQGEVVGSSGPDATHARDFAYLWRDGEVIDLGNFGGESAFAQGINEYSQVTGGAATASGDTHAFLWDDGVLTDLGTFGGATSSGRNVNNLGWVVGLAELPDGTDHAFLWVDGELHDLNDFLPEGSGWELHVAANINDQGWITGEGTIDGETRAFLLAPAAYDVTELGTPGGTSSASLGVSPLGVIAGRGEDETGAERAFVWSPEGGLEDLGTFGGEGARAYAVNAAGEVTGSADFAEDGRSEAFLYTEANGLQALGTLGGARSRAFDLNEHGEAVGWAQDADGAFRAFLWTPEGGMEDVLGDRGTQGNAFGFGVNDRGDVVGSSGPDDDHSTDFAFLRADGEVIQLGDFGGGSGFAQGVNNRRQVTGGARNEDDDTVAFVWEAGQLHSLGTLGGDTSSGRKLNDLGQAVGVAANGEGEERGFLWSGGALYDLSTLVSGGWLVTAASDINDRGGIAAEGSRERGPVQALLLTPRVELDATRAVNGASFAAGAIAPGEIATVLGSGIGPAEGVSAMRDADGNLPTELAGVRAIFDGEAAELLFVNHEQINLVVPESVGERPVVRLWVEIDGRETNRTVLRTAEDAPGLFTFAGGVGPVLASRPDWSVVGMDESVSANDVLTLWATGVNAETAQVWIGDVEAEMLWVGDAPGWTGLTQINLRVPAGVTAGVHRLTLEAGEGLSPSGPTLRVSAQ